MSTAELIERRRLADWPDAQAALVDAIAELHARGATWLRAHVTEITRELIVEGWRDWPAEEGELPL